jgi:tetratricopeptide (TPR) repeat protein
MRLHLAKNVFDAYMEKRAVSEYFAKESVFYAIREIDKSIANRPLDVKNYFSELLLYRIISKYDPAILEKAEKRMQEAYARAPNRPEVYREFPELYIAQKDYKKAEEWVRKGAEHFIPTQETHWQLAGVYFQEGDIKNGFSELMEAEKGGFPIYQNPNIFTLISQRLEEARKNDSAGISALLQEIALKNPGLFERIQKDFNH